jgi:hypothetical protein
MSAEAAEVIVDLRIPGGWSGPRELLEQLPVGVKLTPDFLTLPDGSRFEVDMRDADDEFPQVFRSSCRRIPTETERNTIDNYRVNIIISGPGGSFAAAQKMMEAASAIIKAGGAGVFIDNSALSHGGENWLYMTEDGSSDALSFAFVSIVRGETEVYTVGMHVLGLRDIVMKRADVEGGYDIVEVIRYVCAGDKPVEDGHIIGDLDGPRFQAKAEPSSNTRAPKAMQNPFGRLRLVSLKEIAEEN